MKPLISVIVPVYNVEKYLNRCVESIVNQTYEKLEIILVDDGSPDNCPKMCDEWAGKDSRVKVIHKQNGGLSDARNFGIDSAQGEYLIFIDSDDYITNDCINILYNAAVTNNCDMSVGRYVKTQSDNAAFDSSIKDIMVVDAPQYWQQYYELLNSGDFEKSANLIISCCKLVKADAFKNLRFPKGKRNEDEFTTYLLVDNCDKIALADACIYAYYQNESSIMHKALEISYFDGIEAIEGKVRFFLEHKKYECIKQAAIVDLLGSLIVYYFSAKYDFKNSELADKLRHQFKLYYKKLPANIHYGDKPMHMLFYFGELFYRIARKVKNLFG